LAEQEGLSAKGMRYESHLAAFFSQHNIAHTEK